MLSKIVDLWHCARQVSVSTDITRGLEKRIQVAMAAATATTLKHSPPRSGIHTKDNGINAVREKLMFDLKTETDKMKDAILRKEAVVMAVENDNVDVVVEQILR
ncbi:hypothetical protein HN51_041649 [Arachis hypogaea]